MRLTDYHLNFVSKAVQALSGLAASVLLARSLGVVLRGEYAYVVQAAAFITLFMGLGLNQSFPYFFRTSQDREGTYSHFMRLFAWQGVVYAAIAVVAGLLGSGSFALICLLVVPTFLYQQVESIMTGYRIRLKIYVNIAQAIARVVAFALVAFLAPGSLFWPVLVSAVLWLVSVAVYYLVCRPRIPGPVFTKATGSILRFSWLPMLSSILVVANYNLDVLMLKWLGNPVDLGEYAVAASIVTYLWVIPDAIKEVLVSRVVRSDDARLIVRPLGAAVGLTVASAVALTATGWVLIPYLFGREFGGSYVLTVIISLGAVSMVYFKILGTVLLSRGKRRFYFWTLAVAVVANAVVNLYSIPAAGAVGAAWTTVATYTLTGVTFVAYTKHELRLPLRHLLIPPRRRATAASPM